MLEGGITTDCRQPTADLLISRLFLCIHGSPHPIKVALTDVNIHLRKLCGNPPRQKGQLTPLPNNLTEP